jgi:hypothetical protein
MTVDDFAVRREKFNALYTSYARAYERFLENGFKTSTVLLVILGWLLSSESARKFFTEHTPALWVSMVLIGLGALSLFATFHRLSRLSASLRARLDALSFIESDFCDQHRIPPLIYWSVIGQNLMVCLLIIGIMLWLAFT